VAPGTDDRGETAFDVKGLSAAGAYSVYVDGVPVASVSRGRVTRTGQGLTATWTKSGELKLAFRLGSGTAITIEPDTSQRTASR
jgi:hypothetical protein